MTENAAVWVSARGCNANARLYVVRATPGGKYAGAFNSGNGSAAEGVPLIQYGTGTSSTDVTNSIGAAVTATAACVSIMHAGAATLPVDVLLR